MIRNYLNEPVTAKEKAQELLKMSTVEMVTLWAGSCKSKDKIKTKEIESVQNQLNKLGNRILKTLCYLPKF